jgi:hypothetical protein
MIPSWDWPDQLHGLCNEMQDWGPGRCLGAVIGHSGYGFAGNSCVESEG